MAHVLTSAPVNELRDNHWVLNPVTGLYERTTLLEKASTNLCLQSENFGTTWTVTGTPTRVAAAHTASGVTLDLLGDDSGAAVEYYAQVIGFTGNAVKSVSVVVKRGPSPAASGSLIAIGDLTAVANRLLATVTFSADGVPSVVMTTGTYLGPESLADGAYRLYFVTTTVTAANTNDVEIIPAGTLAETGNVYAGGVQCEDSTVPTSYKKTTTVAVTRATDSLSFPYTDVPQALTVYAKFIERGTIRTANGIVLAIGSAAAATPILVVVESGGFYRGTHDNGTPVSSTLAVAPVWGDTVELLLTLSSQGAVTLSQSINGAAATTAATSANNSLGAAWSDDLLWLNSVGATQQGVIALLAVKIAKGTKSLTEMRALADMAHAVLVLDAGDAHAITVPCASAQKAESEDIGGKGRAFAGNLRVSTQDQKRVWTPTTSWLELEAKQAIELLIADNAPMPCSGLLLDNETVNCSVKCTGVTMHPGSSFFALSLTVTEV